MLGSSEDMLLAELREADCVGSDNVHLNFKTDKTAATVLFYHRLVEANRNERRSELAKRRRTDFMIFGI
jgi:hypothetical protein